MGLSGGSSTAKHAARGVKHYQRNHENIPEGWQSKTGRVWGHSGDWPISEPRKFHLQDHNDDGDGGWFAYRRMIRSWRVADARASGAAWRIRSARQMFKSHEPELSKLRGFSEWIPELTQLRMLVNLAERGYAVTDMATGESITRGAGVPLRKPLFRVAAC